ncbi:hypothetical protein AC578_6684 [Pseudocercospora eumusae]|uniref:Chitobiosyldiphosphodolichol beta-mannosyltransferase n=1 Tax=Pseudocercospora eumusae TaxID=321146 RepID=A0A139HI65_9PEZI|nr:hypothetical protein AC578_6684 [Pseudocercospora eumusae]
MPWWDLAWNVSLVLGVLIAVSTGVSLFILPTSYSHFHPRSLSKQAFSEKDQEDAEKSGYAYFEENKNSDGRLNFEASVQVVVLGDIGRSPRMQYHALSIAQHGGIVDIIGYTGAEIHPDILRNRMINIIAIEPLPPQLQTSNRLLFLILAPLKILHQVWSLYHAMAQRTPPSKWMLVQNPPSIPVLAICQIVCFFRNTRLVIDWHNFGYSILALKLGASHPLVKVSEWYEKLISSHGVHAHFTVTNAMARVLNEKWKIHNALPLHDRPADIYQPLTPHSRKQLLLSLPATKPYAQDILLGSCRLLVSSTSWTADEDFSLLLNALVHYSSSIDLASDSETPLPKILAIITGRGPQRDHYLSEIRSLTESGKLDHCLVSTAWLSPQQYAALLGSADLGVSLHTSSSGVDLPMKVVDMFGTGLPVAGWGKFEAWGELVREGENGRGFESAQGLSEILKELFGGDGEELKRLREGAMKETRRRWNDEWMPVAGKLFQLRA